VYWQNGGNQSGAATRATTFDNQRATSGTAPDISFYRNRYYDQKTGRWTQEDPIGIAGGVNLYLFAGNNPATYTDPFGLKVCYEKGADGEALVRATEIATATTITLDKKTNCVVDFMPTGERGYETLQVLFRHLVRSLAQYDVEIAEPFGGPKDRVTSYNSGFYAYRWGGGVASIGRHHLRTVAYASVTVFGLCLPYPRTHGDLPALIAHELLGHGGHREVFGTPSGEPWARKVQNMYHRNVGQPERCGN
jgi:RHS repeat-associated protein